jgi:hypothetical protein
VWKEIESNKEWRGINAGTAVIASSDHQTAKEIITTPLKAPLSG